MLKSNVSFLGLICLISTFLFSCRSGERSETDETLKDSAEPSTSVIDFSVIRHLLDQSKSSDSVQMYSAAPFIFYKTGYLFDTKIKHSIVLTCLNDTTFAVRLYEVNDSSWMMIDSMGGLAANTSMFYIESKDFNFDSRADIYIQYGYSNNYPVSTGHIIIVDPVTRKMSLVPNSELYGNISADYGRKLLHSESKYSSSSSNKEEKIWVRNSKWVNGHYQTVDSTLETVTAPN